MAGSSLGADTAEQTAPLQAVEGDVKGGREGKGKGKERAVEVVSEELNGVSYDGCVGIVEAAPTGSFTEVHLTACTIVDGEFGIGVQFQDCRFENVTFQDCTFTGVVFMGVVLENVTFTDCKFAEFTWRYDEVIGARAGRPEVRSEGVYRGLKSGGRTAQQMQEGTWREIKCTVAQADRPSTEADARYAAQLQYEYEQERHASPATASNSPTPDSSTRSGQDALRAEPLKDKLNDQEHHSRGGTPQVAPSYPPPPRRSAPGCAPGGQSRFRSYTPAITKTQRRAVKSEYDSEWDDLLSSPKPESSKQAPAARPAVGPIPHFRLGLQTRRELSETIMAKLNGVLPPHARKSVAQRVNDKLGAKVTVPLDSTSPTKACPPHRKGTPPKQSSPAPVHHDLPINAASTVTSPANPANVYPRRGREGWVKSDQPSEKKETAPAPIRLNTPAVAGPSKVAPDKAAPSKAAPPMHGLIGYPQSSGSAHARIGGIGGKKGGWVFTHFAEDDDYGV